MNALLTSIQAVRRQMIQFNTYSPFIARMSDVRPINGDFMAFAHAVVSLSETPSSRSSRLSKHLHCLLSFTWC